MGHSVCHIITVVVIGV